jgi:RND family efflux transporter MFP subunit
MPISDISLDAYPGETFTGKVSIVYPTVDSNTRTFPVEVTINNPNQRVRPGMFARVTLNFGTTNSVMVPDQAICKQTGSGERFVYVVNADSTVTHKTIDLGRREGAEYVVNSGVEPGATVVVFGQTLLTDGRKIHVLN